VIDRTGLDATGLPPTVEATLFLILSVAMVLGFVRLVRGPSLPDRVVALDLCAVTVAGFVAVYAIDTGQRALLDAAIVIALITFLGTIGFARYVERRKREE